MLPDLTMTMLAQLGVPARDDRSDPRGRRRHDGNDHGARRVGATESWTSECWSSSGRRTDAGIAVRSAAPGRRETSGLLVVTTPYALFRADDWWPSRTTLREGLVELEKLTLDYARHPWN